MCTLCNVCEESCPEKAINVKLKKDSYIFYFESDGVLPFNVLVKKAFEIFLEKITEFTTKLEDIEIS